MTLEQMVDTWIAAARRRLHKNIERRAQIAAGRPVSTANRSAGQLYRDREAEKQREYEAASIRG